MAQWIETDLCVIGGGSGGLTVAAGAAQMGARVVLIERARMGGECLNCGCVPSKALIAAAGAAETVRRADRFGVSAGPPAIDPAAVHAHVHGVIAAIAPHDSVARFEGLGVRVIAAEGRFIGPRIVRAGETEISARRFVIATGSAPAVPPIPGLDRVAFLTNETVFDLRTPVAHLIVIGGGPIGMELAQAHRRLGARVTVLESGAALGRDDPELRAVVTASFAREGIALYEGATIRAVAPTPDGPAVTFVRDGAQSVVEGSHLLVAVGRAPNLAGLGLAEAGIDHSPAGIAVDARLRTSNRKVFAIGDAAAGHRFTHLAGYQAGIVLRNALFRLPSRVDYRALPWVTYTDPELAQVGMSEAEARRAHGAVRVLRSAFADNDRARTAGAAEGLVKVIVTANGRVVGAGMVGPHAGEAIQLWCLAIANRLKIKDIAGLILPYPTLGEINKRAAGSFYAPSLFSARTQRLVRFLLRFG